MYDDCRMMKVVERMSSNESGDFAFERLFEGFYLIKVTADGYEATTTEPQPAGTTDLRVILKPKA